MLYTYQLLNFLILEVDDRLQYDTFRAIHSKFGKYRVESASNEIKTKLIVVPFGVGHEEYSDADCVSGSGIRFNDGVSVADSKLKWQLRRSGDVTYLSIRDIYIVDYIIYLLLAERGIFLIHAALVSHQDGALAVFGLGGVGKTEVVHNWEDQTYCDDLCLYQNGRVFPFEKQVISSSSELWKKMRTALAANAPFIGIYRKWKQRRKYSPSNLPPALESNGGLSLKKVIYLSRNLSNRNFLGTLESDDFYKIYRQVMDKEFYRSLEFRPFLEISNVIDFHKIKENQYRFAKELAGMIDALDCPVAWSSALLVESIKAKL